MLQNLQVSFEISDITNPEVLNEICTTEYILKH